MPMICFRYVVLLAVGLDLLGSARSTRAESRAEARAEARVTTANTQRARQRFLDGKQAFEAKNYREALRQFEAGYELEPRPGFLLNMGHAARKMGDARRAQELYRKFLRSGPPDDERRVAQKLLDALEKGIEPDPEAAEPFAAMPEALRPSLQLSLRPVAPVMVTAAPADAASDGDPLYKRWWLWAGVGGLAVGVAAVLLVGAVGSGSSVHDSGSWGAIKL
jgi:tetratricopeptide (TPR) repeat protein